MVDAFARVLGTEPPDDAEFAALLELAGIASRRTAAPGSRWLAVRAEVSPSDAPHAPVASPTRPADDHRTPRGAVGAPSR